MLLGEYTFHCRMETAAEVPPFKGSTFRGVFGHALRRVVCALRHQECPSCILRERCIYTRVFETQISFPPGAERPVANPPHPFVIQPPMDDRTTYQPGEAFSCTLLLFGGLVESLPYFIYAVHQMGEIGIGRKIQGRRARFSLEQVSSNGKIVYSKEHNEVRSESTAEEIEVGVPGSIERGPGQPLVVTMETPLRVKQDNKLNADLPYHVLVRAVLRRISSLFAVYGDGDPSLDYKGLVSRAEQVGIAENRLHWFDWSRYSARQDRRMFMGGIMGSITYDGVPADFVPLIRLGARLHLGKATSFGLGRVAVTAKAEGPPARSV